jgi:uncharacterized membrane protein YccC
MKWDREFALSILRPEHFWQLFRLIGACALAYGAAVLIGLTETYWSLITAIVVTQPEFSKTLTAGRDRIIATLIGAAFGFLVLEFAAYGVPKLPLFAAALAVLLLLTAIKPNLRLSGVTLIVVALVPSISEPFARPFDRVVEILLGTVASLIVSAAFNPPALWRRKSDSESLQ